jgi:hypothetical protein
VPVFLLRPAKRESGTVKLLALGRAN